MNIPQVNAAATDRNREQAEWIVKKLGYTYIGADISDAELGGKLESAMGKRIGLAYDEHDQPIALPNGSFTLCQVVGMLKKKGLIYSQSILHDNGNWRFEECRAWALPKGCPCKLLSHAPADPHDLTAAMDALIKVLEAKP